MPYDRKHIVSDVGLGQTKKNSLSGVAAVTKNGATGDFFFHFYKKKKMDNIFLQKKKRMKKKCRPTGHNYGQPLDRKQIFFSGWPEYMYMYMYICI